MISKQQTTTRHIASILVDAVIPVLMLVSFIRQKKQQAYHTINLCFKKYQRWLFNKNQSNKLFSTSYMNYSCIK